MKEDLNIIANLNDHWIIMVRPIIEFVMLSSIGLSLLLISHFVMESQELFLIFMFLGFTMISFEVHRLFMKLLEWEISSWIITTDYVIDFEKSFYHKSDATFVDIDKIEEIERTKHGFWANILDYGDITINVAASPKSIICRDLPNPGRWAEVIKAVQKGDHTPLSHHPSS